MMRSLLLLLGLGVSFFLLPSRRLPAQSRSGADCDHPPPRGSGDFATMAALRSRAWQLFEQTTGAQPVFDSPSWIPRNDAFSPTVPGHGGKGVDLYEAAELIPTGLYTKDQFRLEQLRGGGRPIPEQPVTYESTFFNLAAVRHIHNREYPLYSTDTITALQNAVRGQIPDFTADSIVVKTFWRVLPDKGSVRVGVWGWKGLPHNAVRLLEDADPPDGFPNGHVCVELKPSAKSGCLDARKYFFMTTVKQHGQGYACSNSSVATCPAENLPDGRNLILLAMHIASKEKPDWLWATFWWKGVNRTDSKTPNTAAWTCDNAQRPPELSKGIGANYSMDTTIGIHFQKPVVIGSDLDACGSPPTIGMNEETFAAFNPFVEELRINGRKSSCILCHTGADTNPDTAIPTFPKPCEAGLPTLSDFNRYIRTDYLWSLRNFMNQASSP